MSQALQNANYPVSGSIKVSNIFPGDYGACDEGSFYTASLAATASTAVATTTQALGKTNPVLAIINPYPVGGPGSFNMYLRYVKLVMSVVSGTSTFIAHVGTLDNVNPKLSTVGTVFGVGPNNTNSNSGTTSRASLYGGVNIAVGDTSQGRTVHTGFVTNGLPVAFDTYTLAFGEPVTAMNLIGTMTLVKLITIPVPPVIIAPGWTYTLGLWGTGTAASAATYYMDVGWIERPQGQ
jgi:hypothetical protein